MALIIGQKRLREKLNNYTLATLPKSILFIGEKGCGKNYLAIDLANSLDLPYLIIDSQITEEKLIEYQQSPIPTLYIIELEEFDLKQQNQFLKFVEEPSSTVYIVLTARADNLVLPTILSRCIRFAFDPYTIEELKSFDWMNNITDDRIYNICKTPGQITKIDTKNFNNLFSLCETIIKQINIASYANTVSLSLKINYKEEYDKFDFDFFFDTLEYVASEDYKNTYSAQSLNIYNLVNQYKKKLLIKTVAKENLMLSFLTDLWRLTHERSTT